ncbi:MAG: Zn-dependent hydrolase [Steroidobacteraceae bacterium]|jgi:N-carbamoyl-L-amino-acid hydrolase
MDESLRVDGNRLWDSLMAMAQIGATARGGVCRLALSDEDRIARELFLEWSRMAGCEVHFDEIGNLFARYGGRNPTRAPIVIGSHLDSQPTGGKFDGVYGVLAGLEVIRTLSDSGRLTEAPIEVAVWTNEEGARFSPALLGSAVFAGQLVLSSALDCRDCNGIRLGDELARIDFAGRREASYAAHPVGAHLELHIEQGPVLEAHGSRIGVVTGVQGIRWYDCCVRGEETHAGPTPMSMRRDPVPSTLAIAQRAYAIAQARAPEARATIGTMAFRPGSRNTVPSESRFTIDFRHPDALKLAAMDRELRDFGASLDIARTPIEMIEVFLSPPMHFDPRCVGAVWSAATSLGLAAEEIVSGAGHDSANLARIAPTAMIFIPCQGGVSHNELEAATPDDVVAGANVLLRAALALADG